MRGKVFSVVAALVLCVVICSVASGSYLVTRNNCAHVIMGDVNYDGEVSLPDLSILASAYGKRTGETGYQARADLNCNGGVDQWDYQIYYLGYKMWVEMNSVPQ